MEITTSNQEKKEKNKEVKNFSSEKNSSKKANSSLLLLIIGIALGVLLAGSIGINFTNNNNQKTAGDAIDIFEENGKTWVAFNDPIINVDVVSDKKCDNCVYGDTLEMLKSNLAQTMKVNEVEYDSEKGKELISAFGIKSIPAFIFDDNITKIENYEKAKSAFVEKDSRYFLDSAKIGLPVGRQLESVKAGDKDVFKGPADAPITIIEFSDFQCPYCKKGKDVVDQVMEAYKGQVKLVFKHFPLGFHENAQKAAEASECANDQGKFWEMHDYMFDNQSKLGVSDLKAAAVKLGLKASEFNNCLDSGKYESKVKDDMNEGSSLGVGGTPAFFINDQMISGAQPFDKFREIIDKELSK